MLIHIFPSGPVDTNAYVAGCTETREAAVIDPSPGSAEPILEFIQRQQLRITHLLLTHSHWDHFADLSILKEKTHAPVFVHPLDLPNVETPGSDGLPLFFPIQGVKVDHQLQEGDIVPVGNLRFHVIHTPGHARGAVCFYEPKEKVLFSGDTLFAGSIGRLDLPTSEPELMWPSLKKLEALPYDVKVYPGHGPRTTIGKEDWLPRAEELFN